MKKVMIGKLEWDPNSPQYKEMVETFNKLNNIWWCERPMVFKDHYMWCGGNGR